MVIADTSPINYLLLIRHIGILPALFSKVILPAAVWAELSHPKAPGVVREWVAVPPAWVDVRPTPSDYARDPRLCPRSAIILAVELHAELLLMDDEEG